MAERVLTRDTLLDMAVNAVPLGMLVFFIALFLAVNPWGWEPFPVVISHGLMVIPIVSLAALTYVAGRAITRDEADERRPGAHAGEAPEGARETQ